MDIQKQEAAFFICSFLIDPVMVFQLPVNLDGHVTPDLAGGFRRGGTSMTDSFFAALHLQDYIAFCKGESVTACQAMVWVGAVPHIAHANGPRHREIRFALPHTFRLVPGFIGAAIGIVGERAGNTDIVPAGLEFRGSCNRIADSKSQGNGSDQ